MRLLLDANLSSKRIGDPLRRAGHDVRGLASEPGLEGLDDPEVLALAAREGRILVTRNSRDFAPILREWAEAERPHAGCILVRSFDHSQFGAITAGIELLLAARSTQAAWREIVMAL